MHFRFFIVLFALLALAACNRNPLEVVVSRCPAVAVIGDLGTFTKFEGTQRTSEDVAYTASIFEVISDCTERSSVAGELEFQISAQAGPALANEVEQISYFIAVLRDNSQIVSKKQFEITLYFDENGHASARETLTQFIPTIEQTRRYNYEVLLGFQLDPNDVVYNLQR